jgi:hypothetical protein
MLFGAISSVPMAVWMVRNMLVASSATGRELAFHPVARSHAWQALYTASGWLLIPQSAPDAVRFVVWLAVAALLAIVTIRFLMESTPIPALIRVLALFVLTYTAFLVISISFLDANTPLDDRILLPVLAALLILALFIVDRLWPLGRGASMVAYASLVLMILLAGGHGLKAAEVAATGYEQGWGFSSVAWQRSPALSQIAHLAPQTPIFSNAPEIVYLHTGRQARGLPRTRFLMNQQPNREFATQIDAVAREIRESCGVVVYLRNLAQQAAAREAETRDRLSLDVLADESDGVLWGVTACQP